MRTRVETNAWKVSVERTAHSAHFEISRLACKLYEREGTPEGKDLLHWFSAESMMESKAREMNK